MSPDQGRRTEGVGIAYHPFLHDALLDGSVSPDFVELPLDLYLDPARAGLLDPAGTRLDEIIAAHRCTWRGTALSLGSLAPTADATDPRLIRRIRRLLEKSAATHYTDVIGFRRIAAEDLGTPQHMPRTEVAARWIAARQSAASEALGVPVRLQLAPSPVTPSPHASDEAAFLHRIAAFADCEFVLDTADLTRMTATSRSDVADVLTALPTAQITVATISHTDEADWAKLSLIADRAHLQSIVLRRDRQLFPLDTIGRDVARAAALLGRSCGRASARLAPPPLAFAAEELAALQAYQSEFIDYFLDPRPDQVPPALAHIPPAERDALATSLCHWRSWHAQVTDIHKARQMAAFLSPRTGPPGPDRAIGRG